MTSLFGQLAVGIPLAPSTKKKRKDFPIGFWIIAKNKLCDKQKLMILARFVHPDNYHR